MVSKQCFLRAQILSLTGSIKIKTELRLKLFGTVLFMYAVAAVISFFVAFLIQMIFVVINLVEKGKKGIEEPGKHLADMNVIQKEAESLGTEGEVFAAIAMALNLYAKEIHEFENMKITIQRSVKPYSPWSSKIYGVSQWKR